MAKRITGKATDDNSVELAPMYVEELKSIQRRELALRMMEVEVLKTVRDGFVEILRDQQRIWKRIGDDLSLDPDKYLYSVQYHGWNEARLLRKPVPPPAEDERRELPLTETPLPQAKEPE